MTTKPAAQPPPAGRRPRLTPLPGLSDPIDMLEQIPHVSRAYLILKTIISTGPTFSSAAKAGSANMPVKRPTPPVPTAW